MSCRMAESYALANVLLAHAGWLQEQDAYLKRRTTEERGLHARRMKDGTTKPVSDELMDTAGSVFRKRKKPRRHI